MRSLKPSASTHPSSCFPNPHLKPKRSPTVTKKSLSQQIQAFHSTSWPYNAIPVTGALNPTTSDLHAGSWCVFFRLFFFLQTILICQQPSPYTPPPNSSNESTAHEDLLCPQKGSFLAFSGGFRACLGRKFAQVEFCTLIAILLKGHTVELIPEKEGEKWKEASDKALISLDDRVTTLAM